MTSTAIAALMWATLAAEPLHSAFGPGEQATYAVSYLGVVVGEAQITAGMPMRQFDAEVWPILCTARTLPQWSVFPVDDRYVSFWGPATNRNVLGRDFTKG